MRLLSFLVLLLFCEITHAQSKTIKFQSGILTLQVNNDWKVEDNHRELIIKFKPGPENLRIIPETARKNQLQEAYKEHFYDLMVETMDDFKVLSDIDTIINGQKFKWVIFNNVDRGVRFKDVMCGTLYEGQHYIFLFFTTENRFNKQYPQFKQLMSSVKFDKPKIYGDDKLRILCNSQWKLKSSTVDGFPMTDVKTIGHSFQINLEGYIHYYDKNGNELYKSLYTYDSLTSTIYLMREARPEQFTIQSISDKEVYFKGTDYMKSECSRRYERIDN